MTLRLIREPSVNGATHGSLYVDGHWQCWSLEDQIRDVKIPKQTAIPPGTYPVRITPSARFERRTPELIDVPNFSAIRIHAGNTVADTEGCLLVGQDRQPGRVLRSRVAFEALMARLELAADPITITIENPAVEKAA